MALYHHINVFSSFFFHSASIDSQKTFDTLPGVTVFGVFPEWGFRALFEMLSSGLGYLIVIFAFSCCVVKKASLKKSMHFFFINGLRYGSLEVISANNIKDLVLI